MRALLFPSYRGSGYGHIGRCLALAEELTRRGWDVGFYLGPPHADRLAADGWTIYRPSASPPPPLHRRLLTMVLGRLHPAPIYLFFSDLNFQALRDGFDAPRLVRQEVTQELDVVQRFDPDVLIGDVWLLTSIVGRLAGLPVVQIVRSAIHPALPRLVWWCDLPPQVHPPAVASVLNPTLAQWGVPPIRRAEDLLDGDLLLVPSTPELDPLPRGVARTHYVGPLVRTAADGQSRPDWLMALPHDRPIVYVTVGGGSDAVRGLNLLPFWEAVFSETDWTVIVSTGGRPVPRHWHPRKNVRAFPWVPGAAMVARAGAVLFHGGYGTMMETLRSGVPSVVLPFHTEQEGNGRRLEASGVARVLLPSNEPYQVTRRRWAGGDYTVLTQHHFDLSAATLRQAIADVLTDTGYRENACRLSQDLRRYGGPAQAVDLIETLFSRSHEHRF